jgi:hypothetical protein
MQKLVCVFSRTYLDSAVRRGLEMPHMSVSTWNMIFSG